MPWVARYNDGTELTQFNADGSEHRYTDIDRSKLVSFALYDADGGKILEVHLEPGQRLIYRRRVETRDGTPLKVVYIVGWQQTIAGQNVQSICYVFPDHVEVAGRWRNDHPWFYSVQYYPEEV